MKTKHKIIIGDSRWMKEVADESVHLIITSPPYWQLKDYGSKKQIFQKKQVLMRKKVFLTIF